ncbi:MAG TPA: sulfate reduction electron transfer complex DsrMKJOP subunit DsrM [Desulfomonilia bacterium]
MGIRSLIISFIFIISLLSAGYALGTFAPWLTASLIFYAAFAVFFAGFIYRVIKWALIPVPFRIPVTCSQQKSLDWINASPIENPSGKTGVFLRMASEIILFRSLFRNSHTRMYEDRPVYGKDTALWLFGLLFHASMLIIVIRHLRFFIEPVPAVINKLSAWDGMFELGVPTIYLSDIIFTVSAIYLFMRRAAVSRLRYISLVQDYIPLLLIISVAGTGILMRHIYKVDLLKVKELATGWISFSMALPEGIGLLFFVHLFCVCALLLWFPLSKLMHMGGVFLSPTRNLANSNRAIRHINPWNAPVKAHTYEEYEDEFREKMKSAGLPVEKE